MSQIFENERLKLAFDLSNGTWSIESKIQPRTVLKNGFCSIRTAKKEWNTFGKDCVLSEAPFDSILGKGTRYQMLYEAQPPENPITFQLNIIKFDDRPFLTLELLIRNDSDGELKVNHISPLTTKASKEGGIYIGKNPSNAIIFENGFSLMEFFLRAMNATEESDSTWMEFVYSKPDLKENLLIGSIDKCDDVCEVITNDEESKGYLFENREGIAEFQARKYYPFPKILPPGENLTSGVWVVMIDVVSGFDALEQYAELIREYCNITVWPHSVPVGWNSWNNPLDTYKEYSYGSNINEDIILKNLELAADAFKPFGLEYWNVDDGYMPDSTMTVDDVDMERFPHGMKYIADKMHEKGLKAGIWINPFNIGAQSKLYAEHQQDGWFPDKDGSFPIKNKWRSIDLSFPEAQDYLRHYIRKVVKEWGFDWIKADFTYLVMSPGKFNKKNMTGPELLRLGYSIIKEEAGPDVVLTGIGGPIGLHWGAVDCERITLDTLPRWGEEQGMGVSISGVMPSYRCMSRRYFYNNRIWFNHMDCLCFRPSLELNETMMLANAMALLSGTFKIGDKMESLSPENIAVIQKMLPVHRFGARPLDIFRTTIPEILALSIKKPSLSWHVVGLFNWGPNHDLIHDQPLPDGEKEIVVNFQELGLNEEENVLVFDFWEEKFLGTFTGQFQMNMVPHFSHVLAIHKAEDYPQYLSNNRHITQGAIEIGDISWEKYNLALQGTIQLVANFEHILYIHVPQGFQFLGADIEGVNKVSSEMQGELLKVKFVAQNGIQNQKTAWKLSFSI